VKPDWGSFEEYVQKTMAIYQVPGLAVAVARDGEQVYSRGFGWRDRDNQLPVTEQTVFGIGSITKSFTAVAIMQLEERGKLSVADPVVKYLPEFRVGRGHAAEAMTIHHFLTHTSGLPPLPSLFLCMARSMEGDPAVKEMPFRADCAKQQPIDTYEQLMEYIANLEVELLGPPGGCFSYSNDAYALLGAIIERVSGQSYQSYVTENILEPLGMNHTTFDLKVMERYPEVTVLYAQREEQGKEEIFAAPQWWEAPAMVAAGFLRSNVTDLLRYMEIYRTGGVGNGQRILSADSVARMTTPFVECQPGLYYGYGLMVHPNYHGVSLVEHGGGIKGVSAYVSCVPEKDITGAALANLGQVPSGQILLGAMNVLLGLPVGTRRLEYRDYACPAERLGRYEGVYISGEGVRCEMAVVDGELHVQLRGKQLRARPVGVDMFTVKMKEEEMLLRFLSDARGQVYAAAFGFRIVHRATDHKGQQTA